MHAKCEALQGMLPICLSVIEKLLATEMTIVWLKYAAQNNVAVS